MDSILDRCEVDENGCWLWQGFLNASGYARAKYLGRNWLLHRLVYELMEGPIPAGLTIDHLCRARPCLNPGHMEPVPIGVNTLRGETIPAMWKRRTAEGNRVGRDQAWAEFRAGPSIRVQH